MSDSGMLVDPRNRRELRIVVASLAASLGIHAAAFGLAPALRIRSVEPPAPISVTLRTAPPTPMVLPEEVAPPTIIEHATKAPRAEEFIPPEHPRPKRLKIAIPVKHPAPSVPPLAAAAPLPTESRVPAPPRVSTGPNTSSLIAVASEPARKLALAPTTPPSFRADYLDNPRPVYPRQARRDGIEGTVRLRVLVTAAGTPGRVELETSSGSDVLDHAALNAVKAWQFAPARRGDETIDAWVLVPVTFRLESG
jgi:periplasmic protein TonB